MLRITMNFDDVQLASNASMRPQRDAADNVDSDSAATRVNVCFNEAAA